MTPVEGVKPEGPFIDLAYTPEQLATGGKSRIFFPLRTGVELFSDPMMPRAVARAKQAAVLYDEVVFETGLYEVSIGSEGSNHLWHPQESLTDETLEQSRLIRTPGTSFSTAIQLEGAADAVEVMNSPLVVGYSSQYHTGILDELLTIEPDWVKVLTLSNKPPFSTKEGRLLRRLNRRDRFDDYLMPEGRRGDDLFRRNWIIETFNRDMIISALINAAFNPTSLFAPMARHRGLATTPDGRTALEILVPSVGSLPWEAVVEFRDHPGSAEARAVLREFEDKAAREEPGDAQAYLMRVAQDVAAAMAGAVQELRPNWPEKIAEETTKTAVGFLPVVGQIAGPAIAAAELTAEWMRDRKSWIAALMTLRKHV